jgi:hypothetical protein
MDLVMFFWIVVVGTVVLSAVGAARAVPWAIAVLVLAVQAAGGISYA